MIFTRDARLVPDQEMIFAHDARLVPDQQMIFTRDTRLASDQEMFFTRDARLVPGQEMFFARDARLVPGQAAGTHEVRRVTVIVEPNSRTFPAFPRRGGCAINQCREASLAAQPGRLVTSTKKERFAVPT
jgi:hypothetical protein